MLSDICLYLPATQCIFNLGFSKDVQELFFFLTQLELMFCFLSHVWKAVCSVFRMIRESCQWVNFFQRIHRGRLIALHPLALKQIHPQQGQQCPSRTLAGPRLIGYIARNPVAGREESVLQEIIRDTIQH